jgi:MarR family transcriptional regulator, temperature-dependent positive regulator of motility
MKQNHRAVALQSSPLHLLHRAGQCAEELFTTETGDGDLTPRQFAILASVAQKPDISQTGLVEQTGVDRSTLADIVRRLVKKGLLQRKRTRRDARMYAVRLTTKGLGALSAARPAASRVDQRLLAPLRADQRSRFIEALNEIVRTMTRIQSKAHQT